MAKASASPDTPRPAARQRVEGKHGLHGYVERWPASAEDPRVLLLLDSGRELFVPADVLQPRADGSFYVPMNVTQIERLNDERRGQGTGADPNRRVFPVIEERLDVQKRKVTRGKVRVSKRVEEHEETVDVPVTREEISVERVPVDRFVDAAPQSRYEGDTLIVPVVEEVLVVQKRLRLKEEVRITKKRVEEHSTQRVNLRRENVDVERVQGDAPDEAPGIQSADPGAGPGPRRGRPTEE